MGRRARARAVAARAPEAIVPGARVRTPSPGPTIAKVETHPIVLADMAATVRAVGERDVVGPSKPRARVSRARRARLIPLGPTDVGVRAEIRALVRAAMAGVASRL